MAKALFTAGNPLLDITSNVDSAWLEKYSLKPGTQVLFEPAQEGIFEALSERPDVEYIPGGATLNTARVAKWVGGENLQVSYAGAIGQDKFGSILEEKATSDGVKFLAVHPGPPTGTCAVNIVDTERTLVANLSAAAAFPVSHIKSENVEAAINSADAIYCAGFFITSSAESTLHLGETATKTGKLFTLNLSAPFLIDFFNEPLLKAISHTDILFGNETEAAALAAKQGFETTDIEEIAKKTQALPKEAKEGGSRIVIFTQGSKGTVVATADSVTTYDVPKVENIIDTNGAGDSFVGGFLATYLATKDIKQSVEAGHKAAGKIIQVSSCQFSGIF